MDDPETVQIVVADGQRKTGTGSYVEAGEGAARRKLRELGHNSTRELVNTISTLAQELSRAELPTGVESVTVSVGLALSAEFGVSIAGTGVEADVSVELSWKP